MNPAIYAAVFLPLLIVLLQQEQTDAQMVTTRIRKRRTGKGGTENMNESVKQYVGKNCMIYACNSQMTGNVVSVEENWMTLQTKAGSMLINLDYVSRILECPIKKQR